MDVNTLIGLGILGIVGWLAKGQLSMREDVQKIKTTLGINGNPEIGLVPEVIRLRKSSHDHANKITTLIGIVEELKART